MLEEYGAGDRRHEGAHCQDHVKNQERIAVLEAEVDVAQKDVLTLEQSYQSQMAVLNGIQLTIMRIEDHLAAFVKRYEERVTYGDKVIFERAEEMKEVQKKLTELDNFSWFRKPLNTVRDYFLAIVIGGTILLFAGIIGGWKHVKAWIESLP